MRAWRAPLTQHRTWRSSGAAALRDHYVCYNIRTALIHGQSKKLLSGLDLCLYSLFLQKLSNKSHFELPHSALDNGVPRLFVVCAGPMILVLCCANVCRLKYSQTSMYVFHQYATVRLILQQHCGKRRAIYSAFERAVLQHGFAARFCSAFPRAIAYAYMANLFIARIRD